MHRGLVPQVSLFRTMRNDPDSRYAACVANTLADVETTARERTLRTSTRKQ
jgi:hypothetical protein